MGSTPGNLYVYVIDPELPIYRTAAFTHTRYQRARAHVSVDSARQTFSEVGNTPTRTPPGALLLVVYRERVNISR